MRFKILPAALFLFLTYLSVTGQYSSRADSLLKRLQTEKTDTGKVNLYYRVSYEYQFSDPEKALEFARMALELAEKTGYAKGKGNTLIQLGNIEQLKGNYPEAEKLNLQALEILRKANDQPGISIALNNLGILAHNSNDLDKAMDYYREALEICRRTGRRQGEANALFCIGAVQENRAEYDSAMLYYINGLKISESISDERLMAYARLSIANIYFRMNDLPRALEYYNEVTGFYEKTRNNYGLMKTYLAVGQIYSRLDSIKQAIWYYRQVINTSRLVQSPGDEANAYYSIAGLYESLGQTDSAKTNFIKASTIFNETGNSENFAITNISLARILNSEKKHTEAFSLLKQSIGIASEMGLAPVLSDAAREMAITLASSGRYHEAFYYMNRYAEIKDSLMSVEKQRQILELQTQFETERKEKENELLKKDRKILQTTRNSLVLGVILLGLLALVILRSLSIKKRDNALLKRQKEEIRQQKEIVEKQKTEITDSIRYARRIQTAMLPPAELTEELLPDSFILYLPKDIVSGDFYYLRKITNSMIMVCAADCTGHGVPGAFMSMLGMSLLNDIINTGREKIMKREYTPATILNDLRERVKYSLRQTGREGEARDGMDMSLCIIETDIPRISYAGANNSIYLVHNGELSELKATRNPIGIYLNEVPFTDSHAVIEKNTVVYMFSDGYSDQTGKGGKKFLSKNFKSLLAEVSSRGMEEIKSELYRRHLEWRGAEEQVDDILVIGIRV